MFKGVVIAFMLALMAAPAVATVTEQEDPVVVVLETFAGVLVCAAASPAGVLGMNTYSMRTAMDVAAPAGWAAGDAAAAAKLCSQIGHLWLGSKMMRTGFTPYITAGVKFSNNSGIYEHDFVTPLRLPSAIDPNEVPTFDVPPVSGCTAIGLVIVDDEKSDRMTNCGSPIVQAGALVVALTLGGVDVTDELTTNMRLPVGEDAGGTQYLNIGFAAASAQDGVYPNPFNTALAYWTGGTGSQRNVPIIVTGNATKQLGR